jgi:hypothetical protein
MRQLIKTDKRQQVAQQSVFGRSKPSRLEFLAPLTFILTLTLIPYAAKADVPLAIQRQNAAAAKVNARAAVVAQPNLNCTLIVPTNPLSAKGLATPYQMVATDPNAGPCSETNKEQAAFVQAAVFNPSDGQISVYNPLIIDQGTQPAKPPVVPILPTNAIVALWFGSNAGVLTLQPTGNENLLFSSGCINGGNIFALNQDQFGQVAHCNAVSFFQAAHRAIRNGQLKVPPLGVGKDSKTCPSVRDFSIVDQDQSDNVLTTYLLTADGTQLAQDTRANAAALSGSTQLKNASDNRLVAIALDGALGCSPWKVNDLADPGQQVAALPLNELQARSHQSAPVALVPKNHAFALTNGQPNPLKQNLYRLGMDQPLTFLPPYNNGDTARYCRNIYRMAPGKLQLDEVYFKPAASPMPDVADSLYTFMGQRLDASITLLDCVALTGLPNPITVTRDANGKAIDIAINLPTVANNTAALTPTLQADVQQATPLPVNVGATTTTSVVKTPLTTTSARTAAPLDTTAVTAPTDAIQLDTIPSDAIPPELAPLATPLAPLTTPAAPSTTGAPLQ